jgi:glycosyltransferase involved in cell wall biosynthesis
MGSDFPIRYFPSTSDMPVRKLRICIVTFELLGFWKNGGIGTVSTGLAELLAAAGHNVTVAYTRSDMLTPAEFEIASRRYTAQGITIVPIRRGNLPPLTGPLEGFTGWERYGVYQWLIGQLFDVVHGSEHLGELFYCITAKSIGLAFHNTQFWIGCHGSTQWVLDASNEFVTEPFWIWADAAEQAVICGADLLWVPSRYLISWMRREGFELPDGHTFQQVYRIPDDLGGIGKRDRGSGASLTYAKVNELVFFGRLETRKGIKLFVEALGALSDRLEGVSVTLMGRVGQIDGRPADVFIEERLRDLPICWRLETGFDRREAYEYVTAPGRLAVVASQFDNSPCAVYELLEVEARFIACRSGGIPELIHPNCHAEVLFEYTLESIVSRLQHILGHGAICPVPAVSRKEAEAAWRAAQLVLSTEFAATAVTPSVLHGERIAAAILFDGQTSTLHETIESLNASGSVEEIFIITSDRRAILSREAADGFVRLSLDHFGHSGVARRLAVLKKPVVILRAGAVVDQLSLVRLRDAIVAADAVVPFATAVGLNGRNAVEPHLAGSRTWSFIYGAAKAGAIVSTGLLSFIAARKEDLPGTNILGWLDAAVLAGRKVEPLAEPLINGGRVDHHMHFAADERARLSLCIGEHEIHDRLIAQVAYHSMMQRAQADAATEPASSAAVSPDLLRATECEIAAYRSLLGSRSFRFGSRVAHWFGGAPAVTTNPSAHPDIRLASEAILRSVAWDIGAPIRVLGRIFKFRRLKRKRKAE